jgi:hypothetical protein
MARETGLLPISANFEPATAQAFDARMRTGLKSDLINAGTFGAFTYLGMMVVVYDDTDNNNGLYVLNALPSTTESNWKKVNSCFGVYNSYVDDAGSGYHRIGRCPVDADFTNIKIFLEAKTDAGTTTDTFIDVAVAYRDGNMASARPSIVSNTAHSFNSVTTAENGVVIYNARISQDGSYWYLDIRKYKTTKVSFRCRPLVPNDWEWFEGDLGVAVSASDNERTTVLSQGFSGDNVVANSASSASYATYHLRGGYNGFTTSNTDDKTDQWAYVGYMYLVYNSTYRGGMSWNCDVKFQELNRDSAEVAYTVLDDLNIRMRGYFPAIAASSATFNTTVPDFDVQIVGKSKLAGEDVKMMVHSTSTSVKVLRLWIRLKNPNTTYRISTISGYGGAYHNSSYLLSPSYCYFVGASGGEVTAILPAPAQGSAVDAVKIDHDDLSSFITGVDWDEIGGTQTDINLSGFTDDLTNYVPYTGATAKVDLGDQDFVYGKTKATGLMKHTTGTGEISYITDNSSNWDTAYGWGDHAGLYLKLDQTSKQSIINGKPLFTEGLEISPDKNLSLGDRNTYHHFVTNELTSELSIFSESGLGDKYYFNATVGGIVKIGDYLASVNGTYLEINDGNSLITSNGYHYFVEGLHVPFNKTIELGDVTSSEGHKITPTYSASVNRLEFSTFDSGVGTDMPYLRTTGFNSILLGDVALKQNATILTIDDYNKKVLFYTGTGDTLGLIDNTIYLYKDTIASGDIRLSVYNTLGFWTGAVNKTLTHDETSFVFNDGVDIDGFIKNTGCIMSVGTFGSGTAVPDLGAGTRLLWNARSSSFRVGTVTGTEWDSANIGNYSIGMGYNCKASGVYSICLGTGESTADNTVSIGTNAKATANQGIAIGSGAESTATQAISIGPSCKSTASQAFSTGFACEANGTTSFVGGYQSKANGGTSLAIGFRAIADNSSSVAFGGDCHAVGNYSVAMGQRAKSRQAGYNAFNSDRIRENDDTNFRFGLLSCEMEGFGVGYLGIASEYYDCPEGDNGTMVGLTISLVAKNDDGTKGAFAKRMVLVRILDGAETILGTQTIGVDIDASGIFDSINFYAVGTEVEIEIENGIDEDVGVVAKLEAVENFYKAAEVT